MSTRAIAVDELARLSDHPYVQAEAGGDRVGSAWAGPGSAVGWVVPSGRTPGRGHVVALGAPAEAAALVVAVAATPAAAIGSTSLPRDADEHLAPVYVLDARSDWEWYATRAAPPHVSHEERVRWLVDADTPRLQHLLDTWSPRHDVDPGDPEVRRWCGLWAGDADVADGVASRGDLLAVAAHCERRPGTPVLKSVATCGPALRRGYGAAVTAWLTRTLLQEGYELVTLGMYSDNDAAGRLYRRLGFTLGQEFTSGRLVRVP